MPIYLKYGNIKGDATQKGHESWTDILSLQWGVNRSMNTIGGSTANREGAEAVVHDVTLTKRLDSSSVELFKSACAGRQSYTAQIDLASTGSPGVTYLTYTLDNALVSAYSINSDGDRPFESITLNFTKMEIACSKSDTQNVDQNALRGYYDLATTTAG